MRLNQSQIKLRERIIQVLKEQGFKINPHVRPKGCSKNTYRSTQQKARYEQQSWHLKIPSEVKELERIKDEVISEIDRIHVIYYRPHNWTPVFRIEMASSIATNNSRLAVLLHGLKYQSGTPGIMEPYPLYIADRMVKHLGSAIPAFRQTATKRMTELHQGDIGEIFFSMHGYRTENGR